MLYYKRAVTIFKHYYLVTEIKYFSEQDLMSVSYEGFLKS